MDLVIRRDGQEVAIAIELQRIVGRLVDSDVTC
jgi:hypothetical protein